jgi:hypothetical protein
MKKELIIGTLITGLLGAAHAEPAKDLADAAMKLSAAKNYTWTSARAFGDREPRSTTGKTGSGGHAQLTIPGRDSSIDVLIRNGKAAFKTDEGWQLASSEAEGDENRRFRYLAYMASNYEAPTQRVTELISGITDLKVAEGGTYSGVLTEDGAKKLMSFRRRGRGGDDREPPAIAGAGGSVKFVVTNGVLTKYELTLSGKMTFNEQERDIGRESTVEFSKIGGTSFDIAEEAAGLLASASDK